MSTSWIHVSLTPEAEFRSGGIIADEGQLYFTLDGGDLGSYLIGKQSISTSELVLKTKTRVKNRDTGGTQPIPAVVLTVSTSELDFEAPDLFSWVMRRLDEFKKDTAFSPLFLKTIILSTTKKSEGQELTLEKAISLLKEQEKCCYRIIPYAGEVLPDGQHFIFEDEVKPCWSLQEDILDAFQLAMLPNPEDANSHTSMRIVSGEGNLKIAIPPRSYFPKTKSKPLNGLRFGIKDIFDVKGVKTTAQSRAYHRLYAECEQTSSAIQKLLEQGAICVGKTKCTQFASSEQPTADWTEYFCPWNPRGDGYMSPRGSSTGTAVAVAGYDWLDFAVGSDSGGSMRGPASVMGIYGNRPTFGKLKMDHVLPSAPELDCPAFCTRNGDLFCEITRAWIEEDLNVPATSKPSMDDNLPSQAQSPRPMPKKLIYPTDYFPYHNEEIQKVMESAVCSMEKVLGVTRTVVSLADRWAQDDPTGEGTSLGDYLQTTVMTLIFNGYYQGYKQFRADYKAKFGAEPYVNPVTRHVWKQGEKVTTEQMEVAHGQQRLYKEWLTTRVISSAETIMIFPVGEPAPSYRDAYRSPPDKLPPYRWADREDHQASLAGLPGIVIPIGQVPYHSRVTDAEEFLPVTIEIMGARDTDLDLACLAIAMLEKGGISTEVLAGKVAYESSSWEGV